MGFFNDLRTYFYIRKVIRREKHSVEWERLGLRVDWIGRIWKIVNLPKEYEGDDVLIRNSLAADMAEQYRKYIRNILDIGEFVYEAAESKTKRSYLFVWSPLLNSITTFNVFLLFLSIIGVIVALVNTTAIENYLHNAF